jgi:hypothetical protein
MVPVAVSIFLERCAVALRVRYDLLISCMLILPPSVSLAEQASGRATSAAHSPLASLSAPAPVKAAKDRAKTSTGVQKDQSRSDRALIECILEDVELRSEDPAPGKQTKKELDDALREDDECGAAGFGGVGGIGGPETAGPATGGPPASGQSMSGGSSRGLPAPIGGGFRREPVGVLSNFDSGFRPFSPPRDAACFLAGTRISTPNGDRDIENLRIGDVVTTQTGNQRIKFIPRQVFRRRDGEAWGDGVAPIAIGVGALGHGL